MGWGDWLGTDRVATRNISYLSFEDAKVFVSKLKLKTQKEWNEYCKSGEKPNNIPAKPQRIYSNKGWRGLHDFLGKEK